MRMIRAFLVLALSSSLAAQSPQRGVFLGDIDQNADACTNFFDFANGAWRAANPIPPAMQRWSRRWQSGELAKDQLKTILDELSARRDWPKGSVDQQITDFYVSCLDEKRINEQGLKPIEPYLKEIDAIKNANGLQQMIAKLHDISTYTPFGVVSSPDNHNPTQVIARVFASGIGLPDRDYYLSNEKRFVETRETYRKHIANMFELAGYDADAAKKASTTVFEMETRLAKAHLDNVAARDPHATDHKVTTAALQKMTPHFNWKTYLKRTNIPAGDINVDQPEFMAAVERELVSTPLSDWKTYLKWNVINGVAQHLSQPIADENFAFYGKYLRGAREMKPRATRCVETIDGFLGEALGQRYVDRHFPPENKARMMEMVTNILAAMGDTIRGLDWMGPETKKKALEKLSTFNPKIGYPDKWIDYSSVTITPTDYAQNVQNAARFGTKDDRSQIGKPIDRGRWGMTPPTSNAYYNPLLNEIVFPAGILQPPAFDMKATDAVNYGAIGIVIGHEISHGFDDQGAKYDAQGRLKNWWTDEDLKRFQDRGACVVAQFEGYFIEPGIHHNGKLVLGESIGDLAGAKIAYLGLQKAQQKTPTPIVDAFTPDQQFFIAWGQFRGDELRPETQRLMVQRGPHPTGKYRVIGPLSNMPEFAKAFACKPEAEMVRPAEKRCVVW